MKKKAELFKMCQDLYHLEKQARDMYEEFLLTLKDENEIKVVTQIRDDEAKHMDIAKQLLELVK